MRGRDTTRNMGDRQSRRRRYSICTRFSARLNFLHKLSLFSFAFSATKARFSTEKNKRKRSYNTKLLVRNTCHTKQCAKYLLHQKLLSKLLATHDECGLLLCAQIAGPATTCTTAGYFVPKYVADLLALLGPLSLLPQSDA